MLHRIVKLKIDNENSYYAWSQPFYPIDRNNPNSAWTKDLTKFNIAPFNGKDVN